MLVFPVFQEKQEPGNARGESTLICGHLETEPRAQAVLKSP